MCLIKTVTSHNGVLALAKKPLLAAIEKIKMAGRIYDVFVYVFLINKPLWGCFCGQRSLTSPYLSGGLS